MNKAQAIHSLWASFNIPAYDENTIPQGAKMPYITYQVSTSDINDAVPLTASVWYKSNSWGEISEKVEQIEKYIDGGHTIQTDGGVAFFVKGSPFAQRMADDSSELIRRILINITAEFI